MAAEEFAGAMRHGRRARDDRLVTQVGAKAEREIVRRGVTARAILFAAVHHDPGEVAAQLRGMPGRQSAAELRECRAIDDGEGAQVRRGPRRLDLPDDATDPVDSGLLQALRSERPAAREQFVTQHAEPIDIPARIDVRGIGRSRRWRCGGRA